MGESKELKIKETISFLRLPLMVAIIFIHSVLTSVNIGGVTLVNVGDFPIYDGVNWVFSQEIFRVAMRLFFFFSGFLFFYKSDFSRSIYLGKLKRRVKTLLIPYIFWNLFSLMFYWGAQVFMGSMTSGTNKLIADYSFVDWLNVFWDFNYGMPVNLPLWFIRDLMIMAILSPVLYVLIKYVKLAFVLVLGVLWCCDLWQGVLSVSAVGLFFFSLGAWFSINKVNFVEVFSGWKKCALGLYVMLLVASVALKYGNVMDVYVVVHNLEIMAGLVAVVGWTNYGVERKKLRCNHLLAESSFFIYVYHGLPMLFVTKMWVKTFYPASELSMITGYILIPTVIVLLGIGMYYLMQRYLPRFTKIVMGSR